jgi:hypothetical protein
MRFHGLVLAHKGNYCLSDISLRVRHTFSMQPYGRTFLYVQADLFYDDVWFLTCVENGIE